MFLLHFGVESVRSRFAESADAESERTGCKCFWNKAKARTRMRITKRPGDTCFGNEWGWRSLWYGFHDDRAGRAWCTNGINVVTERILIGIAMFEAIVSE